MKQISLNQSVNWCAFNRQVHMSTCAIAHVKFLVRSMDVSWGNHINLYAATIMKTAVFKNTSTRVVPENKNPKSHAVYFSKLP